MLNYVTGTPIGATFEDGTIGGAETSTTNSQPSPHNVYEERMSRVGMYLDDVHSHTNENIFLLLSLFRVVICVGVLCFCY